MSKVKKGKRVAAAAMAVALSMATVTTVCCRTSEVHVMQKNWIERGPNWLILA